MIFWTQLLLSNVYLENLLLDNTISYLQAFFFFFDNSYLQACVIIILNFQKMLLFEWLKPISMYSQYLLFIWVKKHIQF